jgi:hypothetical protein
MLFPMYVRNVLTNIHTDREGRSDIAILLCLGFEYV